MKRLIWSFPLFIFLLPLFFVLHHNNQLFGFIPLRESIIAMLLSSAFLACCFGVFIVLNRSKLEAAFYAFLLGMFTFYFGDYLDAAKSVFNHSWISSYKIFIPLSLVLIFFFARYITIHQGRLKKFQVYFNILFLLLVIAEFFFLPYHFINLQSHHNLIYPEKPISEKYVPVNTPLEQKPDIFYLVFDAYTNNATLKKLWAFDNSSITGWLTANGFYIVDSSKANYNFTPFSISSTFNMNYINRKFGTEGRIPTVMLRGVRSMSDNETIDILTKEGYQKRFFIPFNSEIEDIGLIKEFNDFARKQLYNQTLPRRFARDVLWNFVSGKLNPGFIKKPRLEDQPAYKNFLQRANDAKKTIESIKQTCNTSSRPPQFVYGHFMITHQPHLFDSLGNPKTGRQLLSQNDLFSTYTQQVKYANSVIKDLVQWIQERNRRNTIIIISGDHGFRDFERSMGEYQFPNFHAIYFPNQNYSGVYKRMSPVNTFRVVFNNHFDQQLPLLKDSSIFVNY